MAGMALGRAGIFFWYKIPMLSGYLVLAAVSIQWLCGSFSGHPRLGRALNIVLPAALSLLLLQEFPARNIESMTYKEKANLDLAQVIKQSSSPGAKVFAGEVGIVGFELMDYYIIDSAGLVSEQVYQIRLADKKELLQKSPSYQWDWWGSAAWVNNVLSHYKPEFIISDVRYLHLSELLKDPGFNSRYRLLKSESTSRETIVLLKRTAADP
jgi:hypothetical protein